MTGARYAWIAWAAPQAERPGRGATRSWVSSDGYFCAGMISRRHPDAVSDGRPAATPRSRSNRETPPPYLSLAIRARVPGANPEVLYGCTGRTCASGRKGVDDSYV